MYSYGTKSTSELLTCTSSIQIVFNEAILHRDISILEGHRSNSRQHELFLQDKSKLDAGESKHNHIVSRAVDAIPFPTTPADWDNREYWVEWSSWIKGLATGMGFILVSGFDWDNDYRVDDQTFYDGPHFQEIS